MHTWCPTTGCAPSTAVGDAPFAAWSCGPVTCASTFSSMRCSRRPPASRHQVWEALRVATHQEKSSWPPTVIGEASTQPWVAQQAATTKADVMVPTAAAFALMAGPRPLASSRMQTSRRFARNRTRPDPPPPWSPHALCDQSVRGKGVDSTAASPTLSPQSSAASAGRNAAFRFGQVLSAAASFAMRAQAFGPMESGRASWPLWQRVLHPGRLRGARQVCSRSAQAAAEAASLPRKPFERRSARPCRRHVMPSMSIRTRRQRKFLTRVLRQGLQLRAAAGRLVLMRSAARA
mmetsp:Transcript_81326/g.226437  ORF Transcript_81326/g.226437 Transcript_81326/m.226437 type:complete len:291 (+) Transcript_81326:307-1179(+)